jgi:hypothetical protein
LGSAEKGFKTLLDRAEVALGLGVAGVGLRQPLRDGQIVPVELFGLLGVPDGPAQVPELVVGDAQVALGFGVAGVGLRQPLRDGQAVPVELFGLLGVPNGPAQVPEVAVGSTQVALGSSISCRVTSVFSRL